LKSRLYHAKSGAKSNWPGTPFKQNELSKVWKQYSLFFQLSVFVGFVMLLRQTFQHEEVCHETFSTSLFFEFVTHVPKTYVSKKDVSKTQFKSVSLQKHVSKTHVAKTHVSKTHVWSTHCSKTFFSKKFVAKMVQKRMSQKRIFPQRMSQKQMSWKHTSVI
jgi:hypothetical protein